MTSSPAGWGSSVSHRPRSLLNPRQRYLQIALNSSLEEARDIISQLPASGRIILEAGTPLIKEYGADAIRQIRAWQTLRAGGLALPATAQALAAGSPLQGLLPHLWRRTAKALDRAAARQNRTALADSSTPSYLVADLKTMDRGEREVRMAAEAGANAVVALGSAPVETLNIFMEECGRAGVDAMIDMMNVEFPLMVLGKLKRIPPVIILHRGVDEEQFNREKQLPLQHIQRIKGTYNTIIAIAGGDTLREVQRAVFNGADIVVIWKSVFHRADDTVRLVEDFLKQIK